MKGHLHAHSLLRTLFSVGLIAVATLLTQGCEQHAGKAKKPTPIVSVIQPARMPIPEQLFFPATTAAFQTVDIVARTRGFITDVCFIDGENVHKVVLLYRLEQAINQAEAEQAQAEVLLARAEVAETRIELKRYQRLVAQRAASQDQLDQATLNYRQAEGDLNNAKARLKSYQQDLIYTDIRAPFSGRMGHTLYYPGQLVGASNSDADTQLTSINQLSPLYIYFSIPSTHLQRVLAHEPNRLTNEKQASRVQFKTIGKHPVAATGTLDFLDTGVNPATGTIDARAVVENPHHSIYPGQSGHLILTLGAARPGLLLPSPAIKLDQLGSFVYVLKNNKVERLAVDRGETFGPWTVVTGITANDWVITTYLDSIHPGETVKSRQITEHRMPKPNSLFDNADQTALPVTDPTGTHADTTHTRRAMPAYTVSRVCTQG